MKLINRLIALINSIIKTIYSFSLKACPYALLLGSVLFLSGILFNVNVIKSLAVCILLLSACFIICEKVYKNKAMPLLAMAALIIRFLISFVFNNIFESFGMDSVEYHYLAFDIIEMLNGGIGYVSIPFLKQFFPNFVAILYYLIGNSRLDATFITGSFSVLAGVFVYLSCCMSKLDKHVGYFSSLGIWFMPGFLFFTSDLLKDSSILLLTALSFYLFALIVYSKASKPSKIALFIALVFTIALNSAFRFYVFAPIVIGFGLGMAFNMLYSRAVKNKIIIGIAFLLFSVMFYVLANRYLGRFIGLNIKQIFEYINAERELAFAYAEAGIKGYDISTFTKALIALPMLCVHYLFQPFITSWFSGNAELYIRLLIPDMLVWYIMIPFIFVGCYAVLSKKNILGISILGYLLVFLCINALLVGNVGAIYRYRLQFQEFAFVIAGIGFMKVFGSRLSNFFLKVGN